MSGVHVCTLLKSFNIEAEILADVDSSGIFIWNIFTTCYLWTCNHFVLYGQFLHGRIFFYQVAGYI